MRDRMVDVIFPIDPTVIADINRKKCHTEYGQYRYYKTFGKVCSLYRLLSEEKELSDDTIANQIKQAMEVNGNGDCAVVLDKKWRYKNEQMTAKRYEWLKKWIIMKIKEWSLPREKWYYLLCRVSDDSDFKWETRKYIDDILSI